MTTYDRVGLGIAWILVGPLAAFVGVFLLWLWWQFLRGFWRDRLR